MKQRSLYLGEKRKMLDNLLDKITEYSDYVTELEDKIKDFADSIASAIGKIGAKRK